MRTQRYPQGTRIRVHRGPFPLDPAFEGRIGTILTLAYRHGNRYGVQLDGESRVRTFVEEELELLA